jgi:hypothetical protein
MLSTCCVGIMLGHRSEASRSARLAHIIIFAREKDTIFRNFSHL